MEEIMNIMPMGDYYVWHCDWCDSTNHTIWTRLERSGFTCSACHHKFMATTESVPVINRIKVSDHGFMQIAL